jgi:short-subunit dehydrogenase
MKFYEGCTALITGASAGLGAEFARQLAPHAHRLVLVARRTDRLEALRDELQSAYPGLTVAIYGADLAQEDRRREFAAWLGEQRIKVDFLINNAGLGDHGAFETSDWNRVRAMLDVNIGALTHLTHLLLPSMRRGGRAAILNVSSVAGFFPLPNMAVYSATKAYVTSLSESLAIELRPYGITVTALCPGPVPTEFFAQARRSEEEDVVAHYDTMPAFVATPAEVVRAGLLAVMKDRPRVIPNPLLAIAVGLALLVPFCLTREILRNFRNKL